MNTSAARQPTGVAKFYSSYSLSQRILGALKKADSPRQALRHVLHQSLTSESDDYGVFDLIKSAFKLPINPGAPIADVADEIWYIADKVGEAVRADNDEVISFLDVLRKLRKKYPQKHPQRDVDASLHTDKKTLIKIGAEHPELRDLIRPMLKQGGDYESDFTKLETSFRDMSEAFKNLMDQTDNFNGYDDEEGLDALPEMFKYEARTFIQNFGKLLTDLEEAAEGTELGEDEIQPVLDFIKDSVKKHILSGR